MKKFALSIIIVCFASAANAQYYDVGSSITGRTDIFGNTTTTHKDSYSNTIGTSTTDHTDILGNTTTEQRSNNQSTNIWSW